MKYDEIISTALDRYFTRLTQVGYFPYDTVYKLVAQAVLIDLSQLFTQEEVEYCKLNNLLESLTDSTCLTSGIYNNCPNMDNLYNQ